MGKAATYGDCRICLKYSKLTDDHVPPQGGTEIEAVEIQNALDFLTGRHDKPNYFISQNGVKFKTLCERCNNYELGKKFDPVLNKFAIDVGKFLNSKLYLPDKVEIETKPNSLIRAVLGHLLAAKTELDKSDFDSAVRGFIFNENKPMPDNINIFYWVYPFRITVICRDFAMPVKRGRFDKLGYFNLIKYFPIGYLISDRNDYEGLDSLNQFRRSKPSEVASIPVQLNFRKPWTWPEAPEPDNFMILGKGYQDTVYAKRKTKKSKKS